MRIYLKISVSLCLILLTFFVSMLSVSAETKTIIFADFSGYEFSVSSYTNGDFVNDDFTSTASSHYENYTSVYQIDPYTISTGTVFFSGFGITNINNPEFMFSFEAFKGQNINMTCGWLFETWYTYFLDGSNLDDWVGSAVLRFYTSLDLSTYFDLSLSSYRTSIGLSSSAVAQATAEATFNFTGTFPTSANTSVYAMTLEFPCYLDARYTTDYPSVSIQFTFNDLVLSNDLTSQEFNNKIDESTNQITQNQDENTDKIVGAIQDQQQQEKEEASQTGNDSVGSVTDAIPDFSSSWIENFSSLIDAFGYEGTDFVLMWPEFVLPSLQIGGLSTEPMRIWNAYEIDFEKLIIEVVPELLLTVARILLTVTLAIFCVVEIMDLILGVLSAFSVRVKQ